ncbi:ATP-binding cassette domain-containing protein, partial [Vibrio parahaemolyticus]
NLERAYTMFPKLRERRRQLAGSLSGGEAQMLAMARGLMSEPKLLIIDEPSLGLAPVVVNELFEILARLKAEGRTII